MQFSTLMIVLQSNYFRICVIAWVYNEYFNKNNNFNV